MATTEEQGSEEGGDEGAERENSKWELVMEMIQTAFRDGVLAEEATWQAMVLIPKVGGD